MDYKKFEVDFFSKNYEIKGHLGSGGYGTIFLCVNNLDKKRYAVKLIPCTDENTKKMLRECKAMAMFEHNNVVNYHCAWLEAGTPECARDFADGLIDSKETEEGDFASKEKEANFGGSVDNSEEKEEEIFAGIDDDCEEKEEEDSAGADDDSEEKEEEIFAGVDDDSEEKEEDSAGTDDDSEEKEEEIFAGVDDDCEEKEEDSAGADDDSEEKEEEIFAGIDDDCEEKEEDSAGADDDSEEKEEEIFAGIDDDSEEKEEENISGGLADSEQKEKEKVKHTRTLCIAMEYYPRVLENELKDGRNFTEEEVRKIFKGLAEAFDYIHGEGWLHCDFHPGNIFLDDKGNPIVGDFGLSRKMEGDVIVSRGKKEYLASEVLNNEGYTCASDMFSFALVMTEVLCSVTSNAEKVEIFTKARNFELPDKLNGWDVVRASVRAILEAPAPTDRLTARNILDSWE